MSAPRVRFLIGGAQKAGTSALARYLSLHPRLRLPVDKEAHVFDAPDFQDAWGHEEVDRRYAVHLDAVHDERALAGDATPIYLLHKRFIERIARYNPAMRWLVLLRDPVERAISHYHMEHARGDETWAFWPAMLVEPWRLRGHADDFRIGSPLRHHSYLLRGDYARQLDALYASFPQDQVLLLTSHELGEDPTGTVRKACAFLGVAPMESPLQAERVFAGDYPAPSRWTRALLRWHMRHERRTLRDRYGISFDA